MDAKKIKEAIEKELGYPIKLWFGVNEKKQLCYSFSEENYDDNVLVQNEDWTKEDAPKDLVDFLVKHLLTRYNLEQIESTTKVFEKEKGDAITDIAFDDNSKEFCEEILSWHRSWNKYDANPKEVKPKSAEDFAKELSEKYFVTKK